jgi:hypothetical protein
MWTKTPEGRKLIQEISKGIISDIAPEEMDLFDELVMEYFQNPTPPDTSTSSKEDPLGFGVEEILIAATPAAAAMADTILNFIMSDLIKVAKEETAETVRGKIKTFFKKDKQEKEEVVPLTREQLEQIKKLARRQAIKFGMNAEKAEKMANALIGLLVLE